MTRNIQGRARRSWLCQRGLLLRDEGRPRHDRGDRPRPPALALLRLQTLPGLGSQAQLLRARGEQLLFYFTFCGKVLVLSQTIRPNAREDSLS